MEASILSFPFVYVASFLRSLSLSGGVGNVLAILLYLVVALLPAWIYIWLKQKKLVEKMDRALILISGYLFYALYYMVNPSLYSEVLPEMAPMLLNVGFYALVFAYLILRMMKWVKAGDRASVQKGLKLMLIILLVCYGINLITSLISIPQAIQALKEGNTALLNHSSGFDGLDGVEELDGLSGGSSDLLGFSCGMLVFQKLIQMIPAACGLVISIYAVRLLSKVAEGLYAEQTLETADKLGTLCQRSLLVIVISQLVGNLAELLFHDYILNLNVIASLPVASVFYTLVVLLITSYMKENQKLKEENDAFI